MPLGLGVMPDQFSSSHIALMWGGELIVSGYTRCTGRGYYAHDLVPCCMVLLGGCSAS